MASKKTKKPGQLLLGLAPCWFEQVKRKAQPAAPAPRLHQIHLDQEKRRIAIQLGFPGVVPPPVVVECVAQGRRLRVRPASDGYQALFCQFPQKLRQPGARFSVERLEEVRRGERLVCYRAAGQIVRLHDPLPLLAAAGAVESAMGAGA